MAIYQTLLTVEWISTIIVTVYARVRGGLLYSELINKNIVVRRWNWSSIKVELRKLEAKTKSSEIKEKVEKIMMFKYLSNIIFLVGFLLAFILCVLSWTHKS